MPDRRLEVGTLANRYRTRGLLLDANILVLYLAGLHDVRLLGRLKATRGSGFGTEDFQFVAQLAVQFDRVVTTPHVLTEVNGLVNTGVPSQWRWDVLETFGDVIGRLVEVREPAGELASDPAFRRLGLTDVGVLSVAETGPVVMSTDLDLCVTLESRGLDVINYNRVRPL